MKRLITLILLFGILCSCACAEPYTSVNPRLCAAEEVDVSGVTLANGRLTGEIGLPESAGDVRLLIDCPLPENFSQEQRQKLTVSYQKITSDMLAQAIASIGQHTEGGELRHFISDPLNCMAQFELEKNLSYASVIPAEGGSHEKEMEKAKQLLRELANSLNVQLNEDFLSAQRNTFDDLNRITPGETSASPELMEHNRKSFLYQEQKYGGRSGEDEITLLRAMYELNGLPVMNQRYWMQKGVAYGASSEILAAVNDSGQLVQAGVWGVPAVENQEALDIPQKDWQTFLREWVSAVYWPSSQLTETVEYSQTYGEVIHYGSYEVITRIAPCWVGRDKYTLEPGWYGIIEQRLLSDDSAVYERLQYLSAVDFARVF